MDGVRGLVKLPDGRIFGKRDATYGAALFEIDVKAGGWGSQYATDLNEFAYYIGGSGGGYYDIFEVDSDTVYGWRLAEGKRVKVIDWMSQHLRFTFDSRNIVMAGDDIYCLTGDSRTVTLIRFIRTDAPPENEKKIITLATASGMERHSYAINHFNETNPNYEIKIKRYSADNILALHTDIITGNIPDVFLFDSFVFDFDLYAGKNLFADLYEFIDNDPDVSRDDYIANVLNLFETDGKLFSIADSFSIGTVMGRTADVGDGVGWTWDDFNRLMAEKPAGTIPISQSNWAMSGGDFFVRIHGYMISEFVDYYAGLCYYDTPAFIDLLEATKKYYPEKSNYSVTEEAFQEGNPVLLATMLPNFDNWYSTRLEAHYFGTEISYIGYPTVDGACGSFLWPYYEQFAISADSCVKEGAWQYLKFILTDYQHIAVDQDRFAFPVLLSALNKSAEIAMQEWASDSANNDARIATGRKGYEDSEGYYIRIPTENDIRKIYDIIHSLTVMVKPGSDISQIVHEETAAFFSGQKSAQETAKIIQNRVSLKLMEMDYEREDNNMKKRYIIIGAIVVIFGALSGWLLYGIKAIRKER